jgi:hypothetical protein
MRPIVAACFFALTFAASAQSHLPPGVGGSPPALATRSASHYLDLERALAAALQEGRRDAVASMLAPDFELRSPETLDAVAGVDGLVGLARGSGSTLHVRDLAVREFVEVAVVSYLLDVDGRGKRSTLYVVDVWQPAAGKLAARYVTQPVRALPAPARPRGRE